MISLDDPLAIATIGLVGATVTYAYFTWRLFPAFESATQNPDDNSEKSDRSFYR